MNRNRDIEVHYMDNEFPYTATESFVDFFQGLTHDVPSAYSTQENVEWCMNMHSYKFGYSGPLQSNSYYGPYNDGNDDLASTRAWEYPSMVTQQEDLPQPQLDHQYVPDDQYTDAFEGSPVSWQDNIDPDNMTYEELVDLGETVGSESRGLSEELITMLPTSKYKHGSFFSRKKSGERCVICQMRYKRGDKQTTLPCNHVYHCQCIAKWLGINKICPVCNVEVFGDDSPN